MSVSIAGDGTLTGVDPALSGFGLAKQIVQTVKTDTFTTASATFTPVTGLSVTITPTSASSKVMVVAQISNSSNSNAGGGAFRLMRGATAIGVGDAAGNRPLATSFGSAYEGDTSVIYFVDSPATTSSTTYSIEIAVAGQGITSHRVNLKQADTDTTDAIYARGISTITAIEVAA